MANELKLTFTGATPVTLVGLIQNANGQFYNTGTSAFESYNASNVANYSAASFSQIASTPEFLGSMPSSIATAGRYRIVVYAKAGATLATSDLVAASFAGSDQIEWKGAAELSQAADINVNTLANGTAIAGLPTASAIGTLVASDILATPNNKLATNSSGQVQTSNAGTNVTVAGYASGQDPASLLAGGVTVSSASVTAIASAASSGAPSAASIATAVLTTPMIESYAGVGSAPTLAQAQFMALGREGQYKVAGTSITTYKLDGVTVAEVFTMDSSTQPTQRIRSA